MLQILESQLFIFSDIGDISSISCCCKWQGVRQCVHTAIYRSIQIHAWIEGVRAFADYPSECETWSIQKGQCRLGWRPWEWLPYWLARSCSGLYWTRTSEGLPLPAIDFLLGLCCPLQIFALSDNPLWLCVNLDICDHVTKLVRSLNPLVKEKKSIFSHRI